MKFMLFKKKGLSPVVATTLLIVLVVILAALLWIWIKAFVGEKVVKEGEAIENFCDKLQFNADVYDDSGTLKVDIENVGNVPIYGVEIKQKGFASLKTIGSATSSSESITSGETVRGIEVLVSGSSVTTNDQIIVLPMLLGKASNEDKKSYTCDKKFGIEKVVG